MKYATNTGHTYFQYHILEDREAKVWGRINYDDNLMAIPFQAVKNPIVMSGWSGNWIKFADVSEN